MGYMEAAKIGTEIAEKVDSLRREVLGTAASLGFSQPNPKQPWLEDPYWHLWSVHTRVEDVSPEETGKRVEKFLQEGGAG
jgi:hypothetical protein